MLRLKKILLVAGLLAGALFGATTLGSSSAQAHDWGYGGYYGHTSYYVPAYRVYTYRVLPSYYHCYPTYSYGYGW
jgi:hypothetical protein